MNIPVNISDTYPSNGNPIKKDTYLRNEDYDFSIESNESSNKQNFETMDIIYKQDVDLGFSFTPTNVSSNFNNYYCKREEDTEKVEAIQSLKDCKTTEMNYLQDLDLGYFLSSPCQINRKEPEVCGNKDECINGTVKKKAESNSLVEGLPSNAVDGWAGIPFKIDNETGEYIRLPLDELFQDVLPLNDDNSSDISLKSPSSIISNNPRMDTRIQDIANIFSPVSGFCGTNTDISPYPRYHTHFQTKNNSNIISYASRQPSFHNIHREENCYPSNYSQNMESIGFTYTNGEYRNVATSSVDTCPNEGFLSQFLNEECIHLMDISGNEKPTQCSHDSTLPVTISDVTPSQSNKSTDIDSSTCTNIIERFDLSCDSAVSSLSSERVHSTSDGEWGEGSDSGQDYHQTNYYGPHDYSSSNRSFSSRTMHVAQKKYHLYGRRYYQEQSLENSIIQSTHQSTNSEAEHDRIENIVENSMYSECMVQMHHPFQRNYSKFNHSIVMSERDKCVLQRSREHLIRHNHTYTLLNGSREPQARESSEAKYVSADGHLTRDEKRARNLNVPISVTDIINLPMDEFNERISKYDLTENQLSLIRDIRRRGKNKVAAQNCRKRKLDQIISLEGEVKEVRRRKEKLCNDRAFIAAEKKRIANKFANLHQHIFQFLRDDDGNPCSPSKYSLQQAPDGTVYLLLRENFKVDTETHMPFLIETNEMTSTSNLFHKRLLPLENKDNLENLSCQSITDPN